MYFPELALGSTLLLFFFLPGCHCPYLSSETLLLLLLLSCFSRVRLLETPWTAAHQAPLSMGFSRQEYWSGVPLPSLSETLHILKHIIEESVPMESLPDAFFLPL